MGVRAPTATTRLPPTTQIALDCSRLSVPSVYLLNKMPRRSAVDALGQSSVTFDPYSFRKYMNDIGGAYRNQAMELISICRLFSQVAEQVFTQDAELTK